MAQGETQAAVEISGALEGTGLNAAGDLVDIERM